MSVTFSPALPKKIYVLFHIGSGVLCLLSRRSVSSFVPNCDSYFFVKWDELLCNVFYVMRFDLRILYCDVHERPVALDVHSTWTQLIIIVALRRPRCESEP